MKAIRLALKKKKIKLSLKDWFNRREAEGYRKEDFYETSTKTKKAIDRILSDSDCGADPFNSFVFPAIVGGNVEEVDYGTFLTMVENKEVSKVQLEGESIYFTDKSEDSRQYETTRFDDPDLVNRLEKQDVSSEELRIDR